MCAAERVAVRGSVCAVSDAVYAALSGAVHAAMNGAESDAVYATVSATM